MTDDDVKQYMARVGGHSPSSFSAFTFTQILEMLAKNNNFGATRFRSVAHAMAKLLDEKEREKFEKLEVPPLKSVCQVCWQPVDDGVDECDDCKKL